MRRFALPGVVSHVPPALMSTLAILASAIPARSQQSYDNVQIQTQKVAEHIYMLTGAGGNIGVSAGTDGVFLIDDQFAPLTPKIKTALQAISDRPVRFVLNTHWHGDHTGGNDNLGRGGAVIVAQENVRKRLSVDQILDRGVAKLDTVRAAPAAALPIITFKDAVTFYLNGDEVDAFHVAKAHTDGDAIIQFRSANVVHMGDTFWNGIYPFIDLSSGGSIDGMIAADDRVLAMVDDQTKIIPGHGTLSDRKGLKAFRDMLVAARDRVRQAVSQGKSLEALQASHPMADFDPVWGTKKSMPPERFLKNVYNDVSRR